MTKQEELLQLRKSYKFTERQIQHIGQRVNEKILQNPELKELTFKNLSLPAQGRAGEMLLGAYEQHKEGAIISFLSLFNALKNESVFKAPSSPDNNIKELLTGVSNISDVKEKKQFLAFVNNTVVPRLRPYLVDMYTEQDAILTENLRIAKEFIAHGKVKKVVTEGSSPSK